VSSPAESLTQSPLVLPKVANYHFSRSIVTGLVVLLDALIVTGFGAIFYFIYLDASPVLFPRYAALVGLYTILVVQSFQMIKLYRFNNILQPRKHARKIPLVCGAIFLVMVLIGFALKVSADFSRVWTFAWILSTTTLLWSARFFVRAVVRRATVAGHLTRNIVVYGGGEHGAKLIDHIHNLDEPWNRIIGVFDDRLNRIGDTVSGYPLLGNLRDMLEYGRHNRSDEILIALPWNSHKRILEIVRILTALPSNIRLSSEILGKDLLRQSVSYKFGIPMLNILEKPVTGWGAFSKTLLDYFLGIIFTIIGAPIMLLIALAIKLESKGPVLFKQQRYGFNNQLIGVYKFRSMYTDRCDADAEQLTTENDPRVTKVGAFIRKTSLDELPQLFNVLKGEMSVVGPRPHATKAKAAGKLYEDVVDGYAVRHKVKPGITGWAQVNGWRGNTDTEEDIMGRLEHDFYYIDNWSVLFDIYILLRTFKVVASGDNAY
jgi:Undecaprenyl-phosphate glucose phosphotransferase